VVAEPIYVIVVVGLLLAEVSYQIRDNNWRANEAREPHTNNENGNRGYY